MKKSIKNFVNHVILIEERLKLIVSGEDLNAGSLALFSCLTKVLDMYPHGDSDQIKFLKRSIVIFEETLEKAISENK